MKHYFHEMTKIARDLNGKPWSNPGNPPQSFGCLSLIMEVYKRLGIEIPWDEFREAINKLYGLKPGWWLNPDADDLFAPFSKLAIEISITQIMAGDLILFRLERGQGDEMIHPAVAMSAGRFIHCKNPTGIECPKLHNIYLKYFHKAFRLGE